MNSKPVNFSCRSLDTVSVAAERKESTRIGFTILRRSHWWWECSSSNPAPTVPRLAPMEVT